MNTQFFIHIDADAFFASVEQCLHRELRNKPIVTGRDGSIAVAMSYEAKKLGVERAMPIHEIRKQFPSVQMVVSDYFMYRLYSERMFSIVSQFIPDIKQKSIDECCADISQNVNSYDEAEQLARTIKEVLKTKLGCSFSIGISSSPLLAKMASGMNKPSGLTVINPTANKDYYEVPVKQVSGLGKKLCYRLSQLGVVRIRDFIEKYPKIRKNFSIAVDDIYYQLQGIPTTRVHHEKPQQSMNRARSFKATDKKEEVFGQLILNYEHLMKKMRNQNLSCSGIYISLRNFDRKSSSGNLHLPTASRDHRVIMQHLQSLFYSLWKTGEAYRYVSLTFAGLRIQSSIQMNLFEEVKVEPQQEEIYTMIDKLDAKFGTAMVSLASTLILPKRLGSHLDLKKNPITPQHPLLKGESLNRRLCYPFLGKV